MILLDINYRPQTWKAPKFSKKGAYDCMYKEKRDVILLIRSQYVGEIIKGPVSAVIKFYFTPPKSSPKKKLPLYYANSIPCLKKMDCTNMQKFIEDCMQGIIIENDSQVTSISSEKLWGTRDHMLITINRVFTSEFE